MAKNNSTRDLLIQLNTNMEAVLQRIEKHGEVLDTIVPELRTNTSSITMIKWGLALGTPTLVGIVAVLNYLRH